RRSTKAHSKAAKLSGEPSATTAPTSPKKLAQWSLALNAQYLVTLRLGRRPLRQTLWVGALVAQWRHMIALHPPIYTHAASPRGGLRLVALVRSWPRRPGWKQGNPKPSVHAKTEVNKG